MVKWSWRGVLHALLPPKPMTLDLEPTRVYDTTPKPIDEMIGAMLAAGSIGGRVGRAEALSVPAVLRGRNELCSIATLPLRLYKGLNIVDSALLRQIDPDVPNVVTLAATVEDLVFEGIAWWLILAKDFDNFPTAARRLDPATVSLDPPTAATNPLPAGYDPRGSAGVWVNGVWTPSNRIIRFDSPNPGLLTAGARPVRRALLLDRLAVVYADNPRPLDYFTDAEDPNVDPMTDDEVPAFLAEWRASRKQGSTAWIPGNVKRVDVDAPSPGDLQLVELQQQVMLELANALGVDPEDLGISTTSRTYFNAVDRRTSKVNNTYGPYMSAVTDRLSMGDVTRRGYTVRFDLTDYLKADPAEQVAYWKGLYDMGAISRDEVRAAAGWSGPVPAQAGAPAAAASAAAVNQAAALTLDAGTRFTLDVPVSGRFTVDAEARTIRGLAMPYGKTATKYGVTYSFAPGSLEWSDVGRVKHLKDHVTPVGKAVELNDTRAGLEVALSVAGGVDGSPERMTRDQLLADAADGIYDGLSVGVDFNADPAAGDVRLLDDGTVQVLRATLNEISTTAMPAFDDARVTSVAASRDGGTMQCIHCGQPHAPGVACATFAAQQAPANPPAPAAPQAPAQPVEPATFAAGGPVVPPQPQGPAVVDPTRRAFAAVREADPYRLVFTGDVRTGQALVLPGTHDFSRDLHAFFVAGDTAAHDRAMSFVRQQFNVATTDINELNPTRQRPDMYVAQRQYRYPIWSAVNKGTLGDITPFQFPKFSSASGLVGDHTEGTEPTTGTFVTTGQTVTPTAVSGLATINREVWDQGGNPQVSTLIWNQMVQAWYEALEAYIVTVLAAGTYTDLATFTAGGGTDYQTLSDEMETALAMLQFARGGYTFDFVATQADLYKHLISAKDDSGRKLYPIAGATNANGSAGQRFGTIEVAGTTFAPAWALAAAGQTGATPSYLLDTAVVHGWASTPQRLTMDQTAVAVVKIGLWGYKAGAVSDTTGVRDINYDPVA